MKTTTDAIPNPGRTTHTGNCGAADWTICSANALVNVTASGHPDTSLKTKRKKKKNTAR